MSNFTKAEEFYLRGFGSQYIKRRTGISMQSLLKQLAARGIKYSKDDIVNYQIDYISQKFTIDDVKSAYQQIMTNYDNLEASKRGRHIEVLGCGFGDYPRVFRAILGDDEYNLLKNKCWHEKQVSTVKKRYGVDNVFDKKVFSTLVSDEILADGRLKRKETMLERYGVEHPNQNVDIVAKMVESCKNTNRERYGVDNPMQRPDIAMKSSKRRQEVMLEKYGVANSVENSEIRNHIFDARRKNHTLNSSKAETVLGDMLREYFGADDVLSNVIVDKRYPYHVDFYIKSLDLFIELNGDKCHGSHWFDENNEQDLQIVKSWSINAQKIEFETNKRSRYSKYIKTWTKTDVDKRRIAKENKLNYLVFWDGSCSQRNHISVPNLIDAKAWFADGCPMPCDWHKENTY